MWRRFSGNDAKNGSHAEPSSLSELRRGKLGTQVVRFHRTEYQRGDSCRERENTEDLLGVLLKCSAK